MNKIIGLFLFSLSLFVSTAIASTQYEQYEVFEDTNGNIYFKLPEQFVLIHSDVSIPLYVTPNNGIFSLKQDTNGNWYTEELTLEQYSELSLIPSDYKLNYSDIDGDGINDLVVSAENVQQDSFILTGLNSGALTFDTYNISRNGIDLSQGSGYQLIDVNDDGIVDINYSDSAVRLGTEQGNYLDLTQKSVVGTLVGATSGQFNVSEDGSATYQIPLSLPEGATGVKPELSISYSSNGGSSTLGRGFNLSGLQAISRCAKSYVQDGVIQGVKLTKDDKYCYNGQALILKSGVQGEQDSVYHTEISSFSTITITSANAQGALTFSVKMKSGDIYSFGNQSVNAYTGESQAPIAYLIDSISDIKNNNINYQYTRSSLSYNEMLLNTIQWGSSNALNEVKINYLESAHKTFSYSHGVLFGQTKIISSIDIIKEGENTSRYNIEWDPNSESDANLYRVNAIQECLVDNGNEQCLAPISFNWSTAQVGTYAKQYCAEYSEKDEDDQGFVEKPYCLRYESRIESETFTVLEPKQKVISDTDDFDEADYSFTGDINGDGTNDVLFYDGNRIKALFSEVSWSNSKPTLSFKYVNSASNADNAKYAKMVDLDGDGTQELLYPDDDDWLVISGNIYGYKSIFPKFDIGKQIYKYRVGGYSSSGEKKISLLDVNGDGFIDMVYEKDKTLRVKYNHDGMFDSNSSVLLSSMSVSDTTSLTYINTPKLKNSAFVDFNGDGISDVIVEGETRFYQCEVRTVFLKRVIYKPIFASANEQESNTYCNTSKSTGEYKGNTHRVTETSDDVPVLLMGTIINGKGGFESAMPLTMLQGVDVETDLQMADFNADGLFDLVYRKDKQWYYALATGTKGFTQSNLVGLSSSLLNAEKAEYYNYHRFIDVNSDGRADILAYIKDGVRNAAYNVYISEIDADGKLSFVQAERIKLNFKFDNAYKQIVRFADFDGDNKLDLLYEDDSHYFQFHSAYNPGIRNNTISSIDFGFGQSTSINYTQLKYAHIDNTFDYVAGLDKERGSNTNYKQSFISDHIIQTELPWVVSSVSDIAYDSSTKERKALSVSYRYGGFISNKLGLGSLGFSTLETTDNQTGIITTTKYKQAFPFIGMPESTEVKLNGKQISYSVNVVAVNNSNTDGIHPYIAESRETENDYRSDGSTSFSNYTKSNFSYDAYGNLITSSVGNYRSTTASTSTQLRRVNTLNAYKGAGGGAEMGRLSKSTVTHFDESNKSTVLSSNFSYYSDGMLKSTTVDDLGTTTEYTYTSRGNKSKECITGAVNTAGTKQTRCTKYNWSSDERYLESTSNDLNQTETYLYNGLDADSVFGRIWSKTTTSANGIAGTQFFDIQGLPVKTIRADGTETNVTRQYVNTSNGANCLANSEYACFYEKTETAGKPTAYTWFNAFGQKVKTQIQAFDGSRWSSNYYTFDKYSRNISSSVPYYENSPNAYSPPSVEKTIYGYDVFGRVLSENTPGIYSNSTREYHGYTTKYTDANNNIRFETTNGLGQLILVRSPSYSLITSKNGKASTVQNLIEYHYDVFGKLEQVDNYTSNASTQKSSIYNLYDKHGRKTDMVDPDKGHWQYEYNAFGELVKQINGEGIVTHKLYDILGRVTQSHTGAYDGYAAKLTCNTYGTNKAKRDVNQLISVKQFSTTSNNCNASNPEWQSTANFDSFARPSSSTVTFDGRSYTTSQTYDAYSRVVNQTLPEGVVITNEYTNNYLKRVKQNGYVIRQINTRNAAGQVTSQSVAANAINSENTFDVSGNGRLESIQVKKSNGKTIHILSYEYDNVGNVERRTHNYQSSQFFDEHFTYDNLYRMRTRDISKQGLDLDGIDDFDFNQAYHYDARGNITQKYSASGASDPLLVQDYTHQWVTRNHSVNGGAYTTKRFKLTGVKLDGNSSYRNYSYDDNGNVKSDGKRTYNYTSFDKPYLMHEVGGDKQLSRFYYGPNRNRYMREDEVKEKGDKLVRYKTHYAGAYERIEKNDNGTVTVEHKYQVAGAIITRKDGSNDYTRLFTHNDLQGSAITITDGSGNVAEQFIYDPWGKKQAITVNNTVNSLVTSMVRGTATTRGYTGHEGISQFNLIHMNGRVYDPTIGRFLQADPHVQAPNNSQNYNRYSYVLNNPMSYTDPSGYFFKKLLKLSQEITGTGHLLRAIAKVPLLNAAVQIAVGIACAPAGASAACVAGYNAAQTFAVTGSLNASLKAGAISYATASAFKAIGDKFTSIGDSNLGAIADSGSLDGLDSLHYFGGNFLTSGQIAGQISAHAVTGGVISTLQGGKFGHGFFSAGVTKGLGGAFLPGGSNLTTKQVVGGAVASAIIGGTASVISGGKFSNGAKTAAFQYLFNQAAIEVNRAELWDNLKRTWGEYWDGVAQNDPGSKLVLEEPLLAISIFSGYGGVALGSARLGQIALTSGYASWLIEPKGEGFGWLMVDLTLGRAKPFFNGTLLEGADTVGGGFSLLQQTYNAGNDNGKTENENN